jgi:alkaline phosphatase D
LRPLTVKRYQYVLSNNHTGYFITAPPVGKVSKRNEGKFTFLHSSCIKPRFPYNPLDHALHIPGFKYLADWIPKLKAHFMIFLGDFIYIDVPHRHGTDRETYRAEYRRVYASPDWPSVSDDLPWIHVLDDHEIANDWDQNTTGIYQAAADPWDLYHVSVNPPAVKPGHTWFTFTQGPASFFLMDTRRYRTPENDDPNRTENSMLGAEQLADLIKFLQEPLPKGVHWKVVVSSVPFTKNWRFGGKDTWGGYLVERQVVLENMWNAGARGIGVIVLSGDRHEFAATAFPPPPGSVYPSSATVYEFSTSPLSMFYLPVRTYKQTDGEDVTIK